MAEHGLKAEACVAPDEVFTVYVRCVTHTVATMQHPRQHALAAFNPVRAFGEGGVRLREAIER